ncbi:MAG TPA: ornithine carbamoyltransferase [Amycolatopsis sp.]|uniref:ornithine carbamoyltransferase n=1 Tax=Amycolatopsis sp. TaxID=37632 RepID=UPI002B492AB6|nr:ornithine carbamoyltransferase [Amycolatopsis sp.]HKS47172.1 ornithine carbamoyltransferase [Amycolatopsis sp.]
MTTAQCPTTARHLLSITDLTDEDLAYVLARAVDFARGNRPSRPPLDGDIVGVYFEQTSTRTRTAFSSGALRLGAQLVTYGPDDLQTKTGETMVDTIRVLSGMLDILVARATLSPAALAELATQSTMSFVNAMSAEEHPTQALADLTTLLCHFGRIDGLRLLYVGEGNSTAAALALALTRFPDVELTLCMPPGYGLPATVRAVAVEQARRCGAVLTERHEMAGLPTKVEVVYTTRWQTTGTAKADPHWRETFAPFHVNGGLWKANPDAVFMHDLPAHRGQEVTADVLDGPFSLAFQQAKHKLHSAMAVLEWCRSPVGTR